MDELVNKYSGYFIVNYESAEVIYTEGYENANGLWCYKLSDLNKMPEVQNPASEQTMPEAIEENVNEEQNAEQQTEENVSAQ